MKSSPVAIACLFDEGELARAVTLGVENSARLVKELMATPPAGIIPPRYLTWTRPTLEGVVVTTDRARFAVPASQFEEFCPTLGAMIRLELYNPLGNC